MNMIGSTKDFLTTENQRNHDAHRVFERFLHRAIGPCEVLVAHHIVFAVNNGEPNEIPSADTLWFDPVLMGSVFGEEKAKTIMLTLAQRTPELRDKVLEDFLDALDLEDPAGTLPKVTGSIKNLIPATAGGPA
jgi:hypothetical protein